MENKQNNKVFVYGKHALTEALQHTPHVIKKVFLASNKDAELNQLLTKNNINVGQLAGDAVSVVGRDAAHQGVIGEIDISRLLIPYEVFIKNLKITPDTALALLDELQDPQNVGAIIRSAAAFGIAGVLIPERNQAPITGAVVKVSAGMAFRIPLVSIGNVNNVVRDLKERGFWIYGLEGTAKQKIDQEKFTEPSVFILGNESDGIREKTLELCDIPVSIPINHQCESLNVAAAAAVSFYVWHSQRKK